MYVAHSFQNAFLLKRVHFPIIFVLFYLDMLGSNKLGNGTTL